MAGNLPPGCTQRECDAAQPGYYDEPDDDNEYDEEEMLMEECGLGADGQCSLAGSEHCDWCCPMRNSEDFAGSAAWNKKHGIPT